MLFSSCSSFFRHRIFLCGRHHMEGRLDALRRVLFSLGSVETSFTLLSHQAGLLTFPSLLYLPDNVVSGVIRADLINGDYSCRYSSGLSPDSLTSGDISRQIALSGCKSSKHLAKNQIKRHIISVREKNIQRDSSSPTSNSTASVLVQISAASSLRR